MTKRLHLPSEPDSVVQAVHFAETVGVESGLPEEAVDRLVLAVGEVVSNAIHHGNALDPTRTVRLYWSGEAGRGWIHIEDEGEGIDHARLDAAVLPDDPLQMDGRGLYLIRTLADRFEVAGARLSLWFEPRAQTTA